MVRFSVEEDEEQIATQINKRKRQQSQGQNQQKLPKYVGNCELFDEFEKKGEISVTIDPDSLDCFICFESLRPPLYQCKNGHVACSTCCTKLPQEKCPTCSYPINYTRCRALEKIIESIKSSCIYSKHGCKETLPYSKILPHQETCKYAPCFCPMLDCKFYGFPQQVATHFVNYHGDSSIEFKYGNQFKLTLGEEKPCTILHEKHGLLFLLLNEKFADAGNALSLVCINQSFISECEFAYEIIVNREERSIQLKASVENVRKWAGVYTRENFLLVPESFYNSYGVIDANVCIQRKANML